MEKCGENIVIENSAEALEVSTAYALHVTPNTLRKADELIDLFSTASAITKDSPNMLSEHASRQVTWGLQQESRLKGDSPNISRRRLFASVRLRQLNLSQKDNELS